MRVADGQYGSYLGGYLSWPQFELRVVEELGTSDSDIFWDVDLVHQTLVTGTKALPREVRERQILLECCQTVMDRCFSTARESRQPGSAHQLGEPADYVISFLGAEPLVGEFRPMGFDPSMLGFYRITEWNAGRRLLRENVGSIRKVDTEIDQDWVPQQDLDEYVAQEAENPGSPCPSLVSYEEDTRESNNEKLRLRVRWSEYYHHVAIRRYMRDHVDQFRLICSRVTRGPTDAGLRKIVERSPRSNIVINVTIQSRAGRIMLIKRPKEARVWGDFFQAGVHETMVWPSHGGQFENCYDLAIRALDEEADIVRPSEYSGVIVFSWFGYYVMDASAYFFAHVRTGLSENQLVEKAKRAKGAFEIEDVAWMDLTRENVNGVLDCWADGAVLEDSAGTDRYGRRYLPHTAVSLSQLFRVSRQGMFR